MMKHRFMLWTEWRSMYLIEMEKVLRFLWLNFLLDLTSTRSIRNRCGSRETHHLESNTVVLDSEYYTKLTLKGLKIIWTSNRKMTKLHLWTWFLTCFSRYWFEPSTDSWSTNCPNYPLRWAAWKSSAVVDSPESGRCTMAGNLSADWWGWAVAVVVDTVVENAWVKHEEDLGYSFLGFDTMVYSGVANEIMLVKMDEQVWAWQAEPRW